MKQLILDLRYLLSLKKGCSFGSYENYKNYESPKKLKRVFGTDLTNLPTPTPSPASIKPIDTNIVYDVCGNEYHIFYYPSYTKGSGSIMSTPGKANVTESSKYEGPQHPICKIEGKNKNFYKDYIISEDFVKIRGKEIIIDKKFNCVNEALFEGECDPILLLGIIVVCYHSLITRLEHYIQILESGKLIDPPHANAPLVTIHKIDALTKKLNEECANDFLNKKIPVLPKIKLLCSYIKKFIENEYDPYNTPDPEEQKLFLEYIINVYRVVLPGGKFSDIPKYNTKIDLTEFLPNTRKKLIF
jgi:hypothetical protein